MIYIKADALQNGLYQIQDGQIHKYKTKGGTVRTYEMGEIVRCKDCKWYESDGGALMVCALTELVADDNDYCSDGERREP